jgi:gamma-glutamylcyclotransferase (GGCT)/AIG2-like uncharacterized protein YtfP
MSDKDENVLICGKCNVPLVMKKTEFAYQKQIISADMFKCPICGLVYIDEKTVRGKMFEVEKALEDK